MCGPLGAMTSLVVEPDRHHFDVIDGLALADLSACRNAVDRRLTSTDILMRGNRAN